MRFVSEILLYRMVNKARDVPGQTAESHTFPACLLLQVLPHNQVETAVFSNTNFQAIRVCTLHCYVRRTSALCAINHFHVFEKFATLHNSSAATSNPL